MYSTHNEGKSVITERFIRTLKNKIYKYMTSISKNVYIDKLDDIVNKYNRRYHSAVKMKPVDVKSSTYINSSKEINDKDPTFIVGDIVRISKCKNIFAIFSKLKIVGTFYEKELQKTNQKEFKVEMALKRKGGKLYVKWKGCDSSFNSWIDKKEYK